MDPRFSYEATDPDEERRRSDFHALCSLHTSNKSPDESIGNKGVGFRSVFALGKRVQVWSRLAEAVDAWWGLEMLDIDGPRIQERIREDPSIRRGLEWIGHASILPDDRHRRPSFYFPLPLHADSAPLMLEGVGVEVDELSTLVVVPLDQDGALDEARAALSELRRTHLYFVGVRPEKRSVVVALRADVEAEPARIPIGWPKDGDEKISLVAAWQSPGGALAQLAKGAEHAVSHPGVAVAWPLGSTLQEPSLYGYLSTQVAAPIGVDIHADFQLASDRTSLRTGEDKVGRYNAALLEAAAELHLRLVLRSAGLDREEQDAFPASRWRYILDPSGIEVLGGTSDRPDLFALLRLLTEEREHPFVVHLERLLFGEGSWHEAETWQRWAGLAGKVFPEARPRPMPRLAYDAFWEASTSWLKRAAQEKREAFGHRRRHLETSIKALVEALRGAGARVVPLIADADLEPEALVEQDFPVPDHRERDEGGGRHERRLFLRRAGEETTAISLPRAVVERGRAVTAYTFTDMFLSDHEKTLGASTFGRWDLLVDLRQLPARSRQWRPSGSIPADVQLQILRFAAELFVARFGTSEAPQTAPEEYGWGWRSIAKTPLQARAGRALSTLFLRNVEGTFEPARQLDVARVDRAWLEPIASAVSGLDLDRFLTFLGVSPVPGLLLVEGGKEDLVPRTDEP
ncbi:MAG TPA: hypothetical protein VL242_24990, partial [Sorangium sp.]|nr:hypothetical protein [Sorangium sp.]